MQIEYTPVRELRPHPNNARTHSRNQIRQIANSIKKFGFCNPVLVDDAKQHPGYSTVSPSIRAASVQAII